MNFVNFAAKEDISFWAQFSEINVYSFEKEDIIFKKTYLIL